jgi:Fe-S cluster biogenesis protein NfuA
MTEVALAGQRIEALLAGLTGPDPRVAEQAEELVRAVSELYGAGLQRIVDSLDEASVRRLAADELVAGLLVLHDLHPVGLVERVGAALEAVRPALGAHAGGVELLGLDEEDDGVVVRLRLEGSCQGCASSLVTVQHSIEKAIRAVAPEVARIEVDGLAEPAPPQQQLLQIQPRHSYAADGSQCPAVSEAATVGAGAGAAGVGT